MGMRGSFVRRHVKATWTALTVIVVPEIQRSIASWRQAYVTVYLSMQKKVWTPNAFCKTTWEFAREYEPVRRRAGATVKERCPLRKMSRKIKSMGWTTTAMAKQMKPATMAMRSVTRNVTRPPRRLHVTANPVETAYALRVGRAPKVVQRIVA